MPLTDSLIAFWELEESSGTRQDAHSNNYDLTETGGTISSAAGVIGSTNAALFVTADANTLDAGDNADFSTGAEVSWEILAWVYPTAIGDTHCIVQKGDDIGAGSTTEWALSVGSGGNPAAWVSDGSTRTFKVHSSTISNNTWAMLSAYYDASTNTLGIAINAGTPETDTTHTTGGWNSTYSVRVGGEQVSRYFTGRIDQVGFWKRVLTSGERTELYNSGAGMTYAAMSSGGGATPSPAAGALTLTGPAVGLGFTFCLPDDA
jgi:hypothetical protein